MTGLLSPVALFRPGTYPLAGLPTIHDKGNEPVLVVDPVTLPVNGEAGCPWDS